jgi:hypothetical protein
MKKYHWTIGDIVKINGETEYYSIGKIYKLERIKRIRKDNRQEVNEMMACIDTGHGYIWADISRLSRT